MTLSCKGHSRIIYIINIALIVSVIFFCSVIDLDASSAYSRILRDEQNKLNRRLAIMKLSNEYIYYNIKPEFNLAEQEEYVRTEIKQIHKAYIEVKEKAERDVKIYHHLVNIIKNSPHTLAARKAHRELPGYLLNIIPNRDYQKAQDAIESYLDLYNTSRADKSEFFNLLVFISVKLEKWKQALFYAEKFLDIESNNYTVLLLKARSLLKIGIIDDAKLILKKV